MRQKRVGATVIKSFALLALLGTAHQAMAQGAATPYPKMASIDQYIMADRAAEIALARSAAPEAISRDAEVLVLGRNGFETAVKGTNGFVCIVERSWTSAPDFDFWNPKVQTPICHNTAAARSHLPRVYKTTELALAGHAKAEIASTLSAAVDKKELLPMEPGAMCYMQSKQGYGGDSVPHWPPHLMFYYTDADPSAWGANLPSSPVFAVKDTGEHVTTFVVAVQQWSDGTAGPAPQPTHQHQ